VYEITIEKYSWNWLLAELNNGENNARRSFFWRK